MKLKQFIEQWLGKNDARLDRLEEQLEIITQQLVKSQAKQELIDKVNDRPSLEKPSPTPTTRPIPRPRHFSITSEDEADFYLDKLKNTRIRVL